MWRSKKFILAVVLSVVMLVGGTAGVALAQSEEDEGLGPRHAVAARVAEILGIDQQELEDAFKQAMSEMREEALDRHLQKLVDEGTLTQEQADEYKEWIESRPDVPMPQKPTRPCTNKADTWGRGGQMPWAQPAPPVS